MCQDTTDIFLKEFFCPENILNLNVLRYIEFPSLLNIV